MSLSGVSLESILHLILDPLQLEAVIENEVLMITTQAAAEDKIKTRLYDVRKLADLKFPLKELPDIITKTVSPATWEGQGGNAVVAVLPGSLFIAQSPRVHDEIRELLRKLERVASTQTRQATLREQAEAKIGKALVSQTQVDFPELPLTECLAFLEDFHKIDIWIDEQALDDEGISPETPITLSVAGIQAKSALHLMLDPLLLEWIIEDEVLKITTKVAAEQKLNVLTYDVSDLLNKNLTAEQLHETLTGTVDPDSWADVGSSPGQAVTIRKVLVVRQTQQNHAGIARLLEQLRRLTP